MSGDSGGLSAAVRRQLRDGVPPEAVIDDLVGRGLSRGAAERFLERARGDGGSPLSAPNGGDRVDAPPAALPSDAPDATTDTGPFAMDEPTRDLFRGALYLGAGIAITVLSFESPRARVTIGLLIWGLWVFGRGVYRCTQRNEPFPADRVLLAAAIPVSVAMALGVYHAYDGKQIFRDREEAAARAAEDRAREADAQARAEREKREAKARRDAEVAAFLTTRTGKIVRASEVLSIGKPEAQCHAALELARLNALHKSHDLLMLGLNDRAAQPARACAARALVMLGELHHAFALYRNWAGSTDPQLQRMGLTGYGEAGPNAEWRRCSFCPRP